MGHSMVSISKRNFRRLAQALLGPFSGSVDSILFQGRCTHQDPSRYEIIFAAFCAAQGRCTGPQGAFLTPFSASPFVANLLPWPSNWLLPRVSGWCVSICSMRDLVRRLAHTSACALFCCRPASAASDAAIRFMNILLLARVSLAFFDASRRFYQILLQNE